MKFKIGDKIKGVGSQSGLGIDGKVGTVKGYSFDKFIFVEFDEAFSMNLHDCAGKTKEGYGWSILEENLVLLEKESFKVGDRIRIRSDDTETQEEFFGKTGTVTDLFCYSNAHIWIELDEKVKTSFTWHINPDALEKIETSQQKEPPIKETRTRFDFVLRAAKKKKTKKTIKICDFCNIELDLSKEDNCWINIKLDGIGIPANLPKDLDLCNECQEKIFTVIEENRNILTKRKKI